MERLAVEIISVADMYAEDNFELVEMSLIHEIAPLVTVDHPNLGRLALDRSAEVTLTKEELFMYQRELDYLLVDETSADLASTKIEKEEYQKIQSLIFPQLKASEPLPLLVPACDVQQVLPKVKGLKDCDEGTVVLMLPLYKEDDIF